MSRSYRRHPVLKDWGHSHKELKRDINRMARRASEDLPPKGNHVHHSALARLYGGDYMFESVCRMTKADAVRVWHEEECAHRHFTPLHDRFATLDRWLAHWKRHYVCK